MYNIRLYYGKVEENNDPDKESKIQVRLLPEMKDVAKSDLPWVRPFLVENMTEEATSHCPLEEGSTVWVFFLDEYFKYGFYIKATFLDDLFDYDSVKSDIDSISDLDSQSYPQPKFTRYKDGTIVFHNSETGETGIYHKSGSYNVIDKDGNVFSYSTGDIKIYNDNGSITIDSNGEIELNNSNTSTFTVKNGSFEFDGNAKSLVKYEDLITALDSMFTQIQTMVMIDPLTGVAGPPQAPFNQMKTTIWDAIKTNAKSTTIKTQS